MPRGFETRWHLFLERQFDSDDFEDLVTSLYRQLPPGSLVAEYGRHLRQELDEKKTLPINLVEFTELRMTTRIDAILPFRIPAVNDLAYIATCFLDDVETLGLDTPPRAERGPLREEISICLLALLHRRQFRLAHRLHMDLQVECPYVGGTARREQLVLMGDLPLGGRAVIFSTPLKAVRWLAMPAASVEHVRNLVAIRGENGLLQLAEA